MMPISNEHMASLPSSAFLHTSKHHAGVETCLNGSFMIQTHQILLLTQHPWTVLFVKSAHDQTLCEGYFDEVCLKY